MADPHGQPAQAVYDAVHGEAQAMLNQIMNSLRQSLGAAAADTLATFAPNPNLPPGARVPSARELESAELAQAAGPEVDEELARPGRIKDMSKAPTTTSGSHFSLKAPEPPKNPKIGAQLAKRAKDIYDQDPEAAQASWNEISEKLDNLAQMVNPYVARNRQYMLNAHHSALSLFEPNLPEEQHWHTDIVIKYAGNTLVFRITTSRGVGGGPIQSSTAVGWLNHHVYNICTYTRDPVSGNRTGLTVLRQGLYNRLENTVKWCVVQYNLVRHSKIQLRLDRAAVQLTFEVVIKSTEHNGRRGAFQTMAAMSLAMFGALRPGTLQANVKEYRDREMFLKWEDIGFSVLAPMRWAAKLDFKHWKGFSDEQGMRKIFTFGPVTKAHNVIFEPATLLLLDGMSRGVFKDITNPRELFEYTGTDIEIKEEFKKCPVFVQRSNRGLDLIEGKPAPPHQISSIINYWVRKSGLRGGGTYGLRRGSAAVFVFSLGKDFALYICNHGDRLGVTLENHYSTGVEHLDIVGTFLGEVQEHMSPLEKKAFKKYQLASPAISVLIKRMQVTSPALDRFTDEDVAQKRARLEEEDEEIKRIPAIQELFKAAQEKWEAFTSMVPGSSVPFSSRSGRQVKGLLSNVPEHDRLVAEGRANQFKRCNKRLQDAKKKAVRKIREKKEKAKIDRGASGSYADRDAAVELMDHESLLVGKAREMHLEEAKEYLHSKRKPTGMKISEARGDVKKLGLSEDIRKQLASLPEPNQSDNNDSSDEGMESEEDITTSSTPLPGKNIPKPSDAPTSSKPQISKIDINLQRPLAVNVDDEPDKGEFDDQSEPDALGIDADFARAIVIRYYWSALEKQMKRKKGKEKQEKDDTGENEASDKEAGEQQGNLVCDLCLEMPTRKDNPKTFMLAGNLARHKLNEHDEWSNLENQMVTDKPDVFKCPACKETFPRLGRCKTHCWKTCPYKDRFIPLKEAHDKPRRGDPQDTAQKQDARREENKIGTAVTAPKYGPEMARDFHDEFTSTPGVVQGWADRTGGLTDDHTHGVPVEDIQGAFGIAAGLAAGETYTPALPTTSSGESSPKYNVNENLTALGQDHITTIRSRMQQAVAKDMKTNSSDYSSDEDEVDGEESDVGDGDSDED